MTFELSTIALCCALALVYAALLPAHWRGWALLVISVAAVYMLQPFSPVRYVDFALPTATLALTIAGWWFTRPPDETPRREDGITLAVIVGLIMAMAFNRFLDVEQRITPSRPPDPLVVLLMLAVFGVLIVLTSRLLRSRAGLTLSILLLAGLFVLLKAEPLGVEVSRLWRSQTGQDVAVAALADINWLGFSYVAFRLIHTLRDRQTGQLPMLSLREYVTYVIFFPAYIAGPIDRAERFVTDFRALPEKIGLDSARFADGLGRIAMGVFKKFVIADTLALGMALTPLNAMQTHSTPGLWLLLYGYALRLFFDFSGYTDVASGVGVLFGVRLPENFDRPYLKTSLTAFWQSWHKTLSDWVRFYVFSPLSRALLMRKPKPSPMLVVLVAQVATMVTIGLWHGITLNFLLWGLWHGLGLFVHKQWSDRTRQWYRSLNNDPARKRAWTVFAWFLTFHYVVVGWVWFALPDFDAALRVFGRLFGVGA